jgi:predicted signal transduction protein with EAL and GGDEF domain
VRGLDSIARSGAKDAIDYLSGVNTLARPGGDEFTILLEGIRDPSDAMRVAERIQTRLAIPLVVDNHEAVISASIGSAFSSVSYVKAEDLLRDAEIAMYRAKRAGKARYEVFDNEMYVGAVKRLTLEADLRKALEFGEFRVYYQPIVSLQSGKIVNFETLSRWQRPEGIVMPGDFIAVADEIGVILSINRELLREACLQIKSWQAEFGANPPLCVSANIAPKQFAQPDLAKQIGVILDETRTDPANVELEITEQIAMSDPERCRIVLSELKALGVRLSIDDFGTGYSSLSRLQGFPVDTLKIDRSFVSKMESDPEIVRIIIMLAHNLGLTVIAEGTENENQVNQLRELGCELAQGYFFGRPATPEATTALLGGHFKTRSKDSAARGAHG